MTRRRRSALTAFSLTFALLATACGATVRPPFSVQVDNREQRVTARKGIDDTKRFDAVYWAFLPRQVPAKPGDTIFFKVASQDEPHTLAMGALVDAAAEQIDALGEEPALDRIEALPEMQRLPSLFPMQPPAEGAPQVNGSAAEPCYLMTGTPPNALAGGAPRCESRRSTAFDGRHAFYSTGWLEDGTNLHLKLSDQVRPGTYNVMCLVHRSAMRAKVVVRGPGESLPRLGDVNRDRREQGDALATQLSDAAKLAWTATPDKAVAGVGSPGVSGFVATFGQKTYRVGVGGQVSWSVYGMHSITFSPRRGQGDGILVRRDGRVRLNAAAWLPVNSPLPPPEAQAFRSPPSDRPTIIDGGEWDGQGSRSSGVLRSVAQQPVVYRLAFGRPGTYSYRCLIHPNMRGRVRVGG